MKFRLPLVICFFITGFHVHGQQIYSDSSLGNLKMYVLPVVYYTPETSWAFGAGGAALFELPGHDSIPSSQVQLGSAYTLFDQILLYFPFQLFFDDYYTYGEVGYYRYTYRFYGIGNNPCTDYELYDVTFPRIRANFYKEISTNFYAGIRYSMEQYNITFMEDGGQLESDQVTGSNGGLINGVGLSLLFDSRNAAINPTKGIYLESYFQRFDSWLGSDFIYIDLLFQLKAYQKITGNHILAGEIYSEWKTGEVPFQQLALLGGNKRMRGYFEGRYRDNAMIEVQTEYRFPIYWRFGGVAFGGLGTVASSPALLSLQNMLYSYGGGLRFILDKERNLNLRFDVGFGRNTNAFYFTVGEAF